MFGLEFLFGPALLALPLAGLPILLHLLYRRKSPVVPFSTLRFIKASIQRTASRKRVQRWLLLASRVLLLALLIWAIAQPARKLTAGWFGGDAVSAVIVVDNSYSMELNDHGAPLLTRANDAVDQLLRNDLQNARVAIFQSLAADKPPGFQSASAIEKNWTDLQPSPSPTPLVDRINSAIDLLNDQPTDQKWLIVITDLQRREFPREIADFPNGRMILIDLHPDDARAAAITKVASEPAQPRLGISGQVATEITGRPEDSRALNLSVASVTAPDVALQQPSLPMAHFDQSGRATVRVPLVFAAHSWLLLKASLQAADDLPWAASRSTLIHIPPPSVVNVLSIPPTNSEADRIVRLAFDPSEGSSPAWPITVRPPGPLRGDEQIVAVNFTHWPDEPTTRTLTEFVRRGGTLVLFIQPGLEQTWTALPDSQKTALLAILPGAPGAPTEQGPFRGSISRANDLLLSDVGDTQSASGKLMVSRIVPFDISDGSVRTILSAAPDNPGIGSKLHGLLMERPLGTGQIFTWATLPTPLYGNLSPYELFLPILVNTSLRPEIESNALNVEIGHTIVLPGQAAPGAAVLDLVPPSGPPYQITATDDAGGRRFISERIDQPGLYTWKKGDEIISYTNVQYPADEAILQYRPAAEVTGSSTDVIVARSIAELQAKMQQASEPQQRWSIPIALVLFLLCLEALMASTSKLWKPVLPRFFPAKLVSAEA
jgi:hypothetical protein